MRASSPTTSTLNSSAHCRSSKTSSVGRSMAATISCATSRTRIRREPSESPATSTLDRQQGVSEAIEPALVVHRPREVEHRSQRNLAVLRRQIALGQPEPGSLGLGQDRPKQAGLSDACLAGQQEQMAAARGSLRDPPVGQVQQVVTTDEEGAQERADVAHWRQV